MLHYYSSFYCRLVWLLCLAGCGPLVQRAAAQVPTWQHVSALLPAASTSSAYLESSVQGDGDALYVAGYFKGTLTLGNTTLISNAGSQDIFVACWHSTTATWAWAQQAGGPRDENQVTISLSGTALYVGGEHIGAMTFGPTALAATTNTDLYVAKLTFTAAGSMWAWVQAAGAGAAKHGGQLAVQGSTIYFSGWYEGATTVGNTALKLYGIGYASSFVAKLTDNGATASWGWVHRLGGYAGYFTARSIAVNANGLYVLCSGSDLAFDTTPITVPGSGNVLLAKIVDDGPSAHCVWATCGGAAYNRQNSLIVQGRDIYVGGAYFGTARFGTTTLANLSLNSYNGFVAKAVDAGTTGSFVWAQRFANNQEGMVSSVAVCGTSVYACGYFLGILTLGNTTLTSVNDTDIYLAKLTDAGTSSSFTWVKQVSSEVTDFSGLLTISSQGRLCMSASMGRNIAFDNLSVPDATYASSLLATLTDVVTLSTAPTTSLPSVSIWPVPVRGPATLTYRLPAAGTVWVTVVDMLGRQVAVPLSEQLQPAGTHSLILPASAPGLYSLLLHYNGTTTRRALVVE